MQKKESVNNGLHVSSACLWDVTTDGTNEIEHIFGAII